MSDRNLRIDWHSEATASGTVLLSQVVDTEVNATQSLVKARGYALLRANDSFECGHRPQVGVFQKILPQGTGLGRIQNAGQTLVKINGVCLATLAGTNTACSEALEEQQNSATFALGQLPLVKVNGAAVLLGR